ncbi:MAG TPA: DUF1501 domain-containing protein [Chthoniobacteraceae bacterium]|jgi:uncharacterized protein (DUF1501 family)
MNSHFQILRTRRQFMRQAACAALGTIGIGGMMRDLRLINSAAAQGTFSDYKALVCIFLTGGNDSNNLVVPTDGTGYSNYSAIRQNLALPQGSLLGINPLNSDGHTYGLHPNCPELRTLFTEGKLALLFNVGVLVYPTSRSQYLANLVPRPSSLFSHADMIQHWQTSIPDQPPKSGWAGRIADLMHPQQYELVNGIPSSNSAKIALCTSLAGTNTLEVGNTFQQYSVSASGAVTLSGMTSARLNAMKDLLGIPTANLQQEVFANVMENAINTGDLLNTAITGTGAGWTWGTPFPTTTLGNQLKMVARLIAARGGLQMKRQIFFCSVGGYDTHTNQIGVDSLTGTQANLLNELSESIFAFQRGIEQIGTAQGDASLPASVTAFTASDFGRTFPSNGTGSDHGWGGHHCIVGGAVQGRRTYGDFPIQEVNGPDDTSTGRWIPRISVDEYSATLARWFGVSASDLGTVFPNLGRFANPNLGLLG